MTPLKVMIIFGTRPEAIKMAPVVKEFQKYPQKFKTIVCVTSQHREMLDQVLSLFEIKPDIDLNLMQENQSLDSLTVDAVKAITVTLLDSEPDLVLVQGDTTTAMTAALSAFYQKIPVGHIEAGLRTKDIYNPFPEEVNRRIISTVTAYHFAPTQKAYETLIEEQVAKEKVFLVGNTVIDALNTIVRDKKPVNLDFKLPNGHRLILITAHRRENFGQPLRDIYNALKEIAKNNPAVDIIYPVHLNPNVQEPAQQMLSSQDRIHLIPPVQYRELVFLLNNCYLVLTDSGGIQEEAPAFGKPVLVMRQETERPEGIEANVAKLVGTDTNNILMQTEVLLNDTAEYEKMSKAISPYGDGKSAMRIVDIISNSFKPEDA